MNERDAMGWYILRLVLSYLAGLMLGGAAFGAYFGGLVLGVFIAVVGGLTYALPLLGIAISLLIAFFGSIQRRLLIWCLLAPIAVVPLWLVFEYQVAFMNRGMSFSHYLTLRHVWDRAILAFICATISSSIFYFWNRRCPAAAA